MTIDEIEAQTAVLEAKAAALIATSEAVAAQVAAWAPLVGAAIEFVDVVQTYHETGAGYADLQAYVRLRDAVRGLGRREAT